MASSPIDELLNQLRASLHARRATTEQRANAVEVALRAYLDAVERDLVREFNHTHGFGAAPAGPTAEAAARALLERVKALPELAALSTQGPELEPKRGAEPKRAATTRTPSKAPGATRAASTLAGALSAQAPVSAPTSKALGKATSAKPAEVATSYPRLAALGRSKPVVVVGRLGNHGRLKALSRELGFAPEWIDTSQHAIASVGNLERRIREARVAGLVLMEGTLNHKHTEPLVGAARLKSLPFAYAGKGGNDKLRQAFTSLERDLAKLKDA